MNRSEPWHHGYVGGPPPCSTAGDEISVEGGSAEPRPGATDLPSFVPERFREPIRAAARRRNVSAALLAAQLMAESNFNPYAVLLRLMGGAGEIAPPALEVRLVD